MKDKKNIIVVVVVVVLLVIIGIVFACLNKDSELAKYSDSTVISSTESYKLDLRIYGNYNDKTYNQIVMVSNYKNTDKNITITNLTGDEEGVVEYLVKSDKKYQVSEGTLSSIDTVLYSETDAYLNGIKKMTSVKEEKSQIISVTTYKVYSGTVSKKVINEIISYTDLGFTVDTDATVEVWLTPTDQVYKVYYKISDLTIYASYFGFGKISEINLDQYA